MIVKDFETLYLLRALDDQSGRILASSSPKVLRPKIRQYLASLDRTTAKTGTVDLLSRPRGGNRAYCEMVGLTSDCPAASENTAI